MALKRLTTEEMIAITSTWVQPEHAHRKALASVPVLAALLPDIDDAHADVCENYQQELTTERIQEIVQTQKRLDDRHDNVLRAIWHYLSAAGYYVREPSAMSALEQLRTKLLPNGLSATQKSYAEEAAQAKHMAERLTSADRVLLASIPVTADTTLLDAVDEWLSLATRLGALENERAGDEGEGSRGLSSQLLASRNQWLRTVHALRTVAALVGQDKPAIQELMESLSAAEKRATQRSVEAPPR